MIPSVPSRILRSILLWFLLAVITIVPLSCVKKRPAAPWPGENWPAATPESQGLDSARLSDAVRTLRNENINIHSILLIRNGYAVLDVAFYPYDGKALHDVASVTKSITATLVGQAVAQGILPPLNTPVREFLTGNTTDETGRGWDEVTLEKLVTMSSGIECGDPPVEETLFHVRRAPDWVRFILDLPVVETPGGRFDYCSPNFHLLSAAVTRGTDVSLAEYAAARLFTPIGIQRFQWPEDPQGISVGWGDLRLNPADMARIGYLYLNEGRWKDHQILPRSWVKAATEWHVATSYEDSDYGYGWWLAKGDFEGVYEARGRGGQNITVWPETGILFVTTGGGYNRDTVVDALLPAIRSDNALPENPVALEDLGRVVAQAAQPPEPLEPGELPSLAGSVSGRWYALDSNVLKLEGLVLSFDGDRDQAALTARIDGEDFSFGVGLDGVYRFSRTSPSGDPAAVRGRWEAEDRFVLDYNEVTRINRFRMDLVFSGSELTLAFSEPTGQIKGKVKGRRVQGLDQE